MKRFTLFFLAAFACLGQSASAQLQILNTQLVSELKNTKTIVFMPASDTTKHQIYRELMEEHWHLTELEFLSYSQYTEYKYKTGYSYLLFGDDHFKSDMMESSYVYFELWLWQGTDGNPERRKKNLLARMELYPDPETTFDPSLIYDYRFNTEGHIFNWTPGMFKNYIQMFHQHLSQGIERGVAKADENMEHLKKLQTKTLYIPEYVLEQHSPNQDILPALTAKELMADYPYPYKVVSNEELSKMLMDSKEELYYLLFVRSNSDKFLSVVEGHDGKLIYNRHTPQSFNVKKADLKKLAKTISQ